MFKISLSLLLAFGLVSKTRQDIFLCSAFFFFIRFFPPERIFNFPFPLPKKAGGRYPSGYQPLWLM